MLKIHQVTGALEVSFLLLVAPPWWTRVAGDLLGTRIIAVLFAVVAGVQVVLHLVSILLSRRLA